MQFKPRYQAIFDKVVHHLFTQGEPSLNEKNGEAYRGLHGRKCPIGMLIPDELYDPSLETSAPQVSMLPENVRRAIGCVDDADIQFYQHLQDAHDGRTRDYWFRKLEIAARLWRLDRTVLDFYRPSVESATASFEGERPASFN